jgi:DNA-directed RNA polymerase specialized sigma24 family protein
VDETKRESTFKAFVLIVEPRLRRSLVATYGYERGTEATCEALAYAWEHWDRVGTFDNPVAYLYRVGQSRTRPRRRRAMHAVSYGEERGVEPALARAVAGLSARQRTAVLLVVGNQWTCGEVGALIGISTSSVQRYVERALAKLRRDLEGGGASGRRTEQQARPDP